MKVAAIILAAGGSTRFPLQNKLLLPITAVPMITKVVKSVLEADYNPVVVVTGYDEHNVRTAIAGFTVRFVTNHEWKSGLASSLKAGVKNLNSNVDGVLFVLADMPLIQVKTLKLIKSGFINELGEKIVYPTYRNKQGNPVLFPKRYFPDILKLQRDKGAKTVLKHNAANTHPVVIDIPEILADCDNEADYQRIINQVNSFH